MSALNRHRTSALPGTALLKGALCLALALPAALWAGPLTIKVPRPNGLDDTANLQAALDAAVTHGPGATVQLAAGTYRTNQLVATNFQGRLKGAGQTQTTLVAKANLPVNVGDGQWPLPDASHPWPVLITFIDGDIRVSDLAISVPTADGTATAVYDSPQFGDGVSGLISVLLFMGQYPTNAVVERVAITGAQDVTPWGYNVITGINYSSYYPDSGNPGGTLWLKGNFTVQNCTLRTMGLGTGFNGRHQDNQVVIGGAPGRGNVIQDVILGIDLELAQNAGFEVSFNQVSARMVGLWETKIFSQGAASYPPTAPSGFFIHDNTFTITGAEAPGEQGAIAIIDTAASPWIRASVYNNRIAMDDMYSYGIIATHTQGTTIRSNTFTGMGTSGINLAGATLATVEDNRFGDFVANTCDIFIDGSSSGNRVILASPDDTVEDYGTDETTYVLPPVNTKDQQ